MTTTMPETLMIKDQDGYAIPPAYDRPPPTAYHQPPPAFPSQLSYQTPQQVYQPPASFDDHAPKYKCCGCCHSKCGSIVVGIVEVILALGGFILSFRTNVTSGVVPLIITICLVALMFYGIRSVKCGFLIAHMVFQVLAIVSFCVILILGIVVLVGMTTYADRLSSSYSSWSEMDAKDWVQLAGILAVVLGVVGAVLEIWFFIVVLKCYRYLRDKHIFNMISVHPVVGFGIMPTMTPGGPAVVAVY